MASSSGKPTAAFSSAEQPRPGEQPGQSRLAKVVSGSLAGVVVSVALQPLDVLRTTMQTDAARTALRQQPLTTLQKVLSEGGARAMWRGSSATVIRLGLGAGFHFLLIDLAKAALDRPLPDGTVGLTPWMAALTGGCSRALSAAALCPVTLVKTRLEYGSGAQMYTGPLTAMRQIYGAEGVRGLFRGLGPTILTNAPFSGLYYMFYTDLKKRMSAEDRNQTLVNFTAGTFAASAATLLTQPADVLRTRTQMGLVQSGASPLSVLRSVMATGGAAALMTGTSPKVLKKILQTALVWTLYEDLVPRLCSIGQALPSYLGPPGNDRVK